jgi:hypothetical protein
VRGDAGAARLLPPHRRASRGRTRQLSTAPPEPERARGRTDGARARAPDRVIAPRAQLLGARHSRSPPSGTI